MTPPVVCAVCKRPLVRTSEAFYACPGPDLSHRSLIPAGHVDDVVMAEAERRARHVKKDRRDEPIEV